MKSLAVMVSDVLKERIVPPFGTVSLIFSQGKLKYVQIEERVDVDQPKIKHYTLTK